MQILARILEREERKVNVVAVMIIKQKEIVKENLISCQYLDAGMNEK